MRDEARVGRMREIGLAVLRVVVGIVFVAHGAQKLFDTGVSNVAGFFGQLGVPAPLLAAWVVTGVELLGGLALVLGVLTRWVVVPLAVNMTVALLLVHLSQGFFLPGGYEFVLTLLSAVVALGLAGPGALSVDNALGREPSVPELAAAPERRRAA